MTEYSPLTPAVAIWVQL